MDALSDVLRAVRLTGATFFDVVARAPWCAEQPTREQVLPKILPGAEHLISYHVVTEGECYAARIGDEPVHLKAGEVVVFTRGDAHVMSSAPGMRAHPVTQQEVDAATAGRCRSSATCSTKVAPAGRQRSSWCAASWPATLSRSIHCSTTCRPSSRAEMPTAR